MALHLPTLFTSLCLPCHRHHRHLSNCHEWHQNVTKFVIIIFRIVTIVIVFIKIVSRHFWHLSLLFTPPHVRRTSWQWRWWLTYILKQINKTAVSICSCLSPIVTIVIVVIIYVSQSLTFPPLYIRPPLTQPPFKLLCSALTKHLTKYLSSFRQRFRHKKCQTTNFVTLMSASHQTDQSLLLNILRRYQVKCGLGAINASVLLNISTCLIHYTRTHLSTAALLQVHVLVLVILARQSY